MGKRVWFAESEQVEIKIVTGRELVAYEVEFSQGRIDFLTGNELDLNVVLGEEESIEEALNREFALSSVEYVDEGIFEVIA